MTKGKYTASGKKLANGGTHYPDVIWENVNSQPSREFDGKIYHQYGGWEFSKIEAKKSADKVRSWGHSARVVASGNHYQVFVRKER